MTVFAIHGVLVGIASVLFATQLSVIQSTVPPNLELTIITAAVVGGVSILGGTGTVIGSTLAAVLLAAIGSSLIFVDISPYWLRAVQGGLILITVLADLMRRRRRCRRSEVGRGDHGRESPGGARPRARFASSHEGVLFLILVAALVVLAHQSDRSSPPATCSIRAG